MQANTALGVRADKDMDTGPDGASELSLKPSSLSTTRQRIRFGAVPPQFLPMLLLALTTGPAHAAAVAEGDQSIAHDSYQTKAPPNEALGSPDYKALVMPDEEKDSFESAFDDQSTFQLTGSAMNRRELGKHHKKHHKKSCEAGTSGGSGKDPCAKCAAGKLSGRGATSCKSCDAGTYSGPGASSCASCGAGKYSGKVETVIPFQSRCNSCAAGTYSGESASSCTPCEVGTSSGESASSCTPCGAGTYSGERAPSCTNCEDGKYSGARATSWPLSCIP